MNVSLICACKNRFNALKIALNSWTSFKEIKEIIIVDWSSDEPIDHLTKLDSRIKILRVDDKKYFNLAQPLNLAASCATGDYIIKVDCDYIINPYYNFFEKYKIDNNSFVSGNVALQKSYEYLDQDGNYSINFKNISIEEIVEYCNSYNHFFKFLKGMLYVSRDNFLKVGGYDEDISDYGWEDTDIVSRLDLLNLEHKKITYDHNLIHIPHPDRKRFENSPNYGIDLENSIRYNLSEVYPEDEVQGQIDYVITQKLINDNKLISKSDPYVKPKTQWTIVPINEKYFLCSEILNSKLNEFPTVYYLSLEESTDRQKNIESQFLKYGITPKSIISKRFSESDDKVFGKYLYTLNDGTKGCCVSHLKAINQWYENTDDDYGFFCEDDLSLETVEYWDFTWEEFIERIPEDAECVQLLTIRDNYDTFELRERKWDDWGVTAYIITRDYAKKIIDTFIKDDCYHLEIPNQDVMPLIENILFASVGKTYTVPLFVENIEFNSTFVGKDDDVKEGQKTNHKLSRNLVLKHWQSEKVKETELEILLKNYAVDTENPEHNFNLGVWYEKEGHTAPALSYYLRCAERSEDQDLAYEALIRGSFCYDKQKERDGSSRSLLWQAQAFRPDRPEAYYLLSRYAERKEWWQDCYINADLALRYCNFDCNSLRTSVEYPGRYGLLYEKAVSGWWWGKSEESKLLLLEILEKYKLSEIDQNTIKERLKSWGVETH